MGVIWDMDGVIIDSVPYHYQAWCDTFMQYGINYTEKIDEKPFGHVETIKSVIEDATEGEIKKIANQKEEIFKNILIKNGVRPLPGVVDLLDSLTKNDFKLGLASSASLQTILLIINAIGIRQHFHAIISAEDVKRPKPDPQTFKMALRKLSISQKFSCVIEDMPAGISAAKKAGVKCIGVTTNHPRDKLAKADIVVDSVKDICINDILVLLDKHC